MSKEAPVGGLQRSWHRVLAALYGRLPLLPALSARRWRIEEGGWIPWSPARLRLPEARVALVTSAGVHLRGDRPFDMENREGDASFRVIPGDSSLSDLIITHDYYDHRATDRDLNCVFPLERLRELARAGWIGSVAPRHVSTMGHILGVEQQRLVAQTAPAIARLLREDRVDYVLATPG